MVFSSLACLTICIFICWFNCFQFSIKRSKPLWFSSRLVIHKRVSQHSFLKVGTSLICLITTAVSLCGITQRRHLGRNTFAHAGERQQLEPEQGQEHLPAALAFPSGRDAHTASGGLTETTTKVCSQQPQHNTKCTSPLLGAIV